MKIAYIHNNKKIGTGAHYINDLIVHKLQEYGAKVKSFYPKFKLTDTPMHFKGINNILFFYSLLEKRDEILKCDIIQGTTYTPIAFMRFQKPVICHFGSTTLGFLQSVPKVNNIEKECSDIFYSLKNAGIINEVNIKSRRPLYDIASIEQYSAEKSDAIIATSKIVKNNLIGVGINKEKIHVIHNAIEDYWFDKRNFRFLEKPILVFLGRIGEDPFTLKLKGFARLVYIYQQFPDIKKLSIVMSGSKKLITWMEKTIPNHQVECNMTKYEIPNKLATCMGGIMLITSRYEGFSLSLIEGMSQGLIPIAFPVGVVPEIIRNGENGYIINSMYEAKDIIKQLISNKGLRKRIAENAIKTAQKFKSDTLIPQIISVYKKYVKK